MYIKIIKRYLLRHINNRWIFLVTGYFNQHELPVKKFKFVVDICDNEINVDKEINRRDVYDFLEQRINEMLSYINSYNDCDLFFDKCNETIRKYINDKKQLKHNG